MRNWGQTYVKRLVLPPRWLPSMPSATSFFFNSKKKEAKNAALKRRGVLCTAQSALRVAQHALACKVGCKMAVGCETALRAVRDGMI